MHESDADSVAHNTAPREIKSSVQEQRILHHCVRIPPNMTGIRKYPIDQKKVLSTGVFPSPPSPHPCLLSLCAVGSGYRRADQPGTAHRHRALSNSQHFTFSNENIKFG